MRIEYIIKVLQNSSLSVFILLILLMIFPLGKVSAHIMLRFLQCTNNELFH